MTWSEPAFDKHAFAGKRVKAVSPTTGISFNDFSRMHVQRREKQQVRRLATPDWSRNDETLREMVMRFCEDRYYLRPLQGASFAERMSRLNEAAQAQLPGKRHSLKFLLQVYNEAGAADAPQSVLDNIAIQVQNKDTEIVVDERGVLAVALSVFYYYYRLGWNSVDIAKQVGIKSPHIRIWLYRINSIASGRAKGKGHGLDKGESLMVRYWAKERIQTLFALVTSGKSFDECAEIMGASHALLHVAWRYHFGSLKRKRNKNSQRCPPNFWGPEEIFWLKVMRAAGVGWRGCSTALGLRSAGSSRSAWMRFCQEAVC